MRKLAGLLLLTALLAAACTSVGPSTETRSLSNPGAILTVETQSAPDLQQDQAAAERLPAHSSVVPPPLPPEPPRSAPRIVPPVSSEPAYQGRCNSGAFAHGKVWPMLPMCISE